MRSYKRTVKAEHVGGLNIAVTFEDGTTGTFDFSPYVEYACYKPLKSGGLFSLVRADHGTVSWPGDIDIAPEAVWSGAVRTH